MTLDQGNLQSYEDCLWSTACTALRRSRPDEFLAFPMVQCRDGVPHPLYILLTCNGICIGPRRWSGDPAGEEACWKATDTDCPAAQTRGTTSRVCLIKSLRLSVLWIAIILPMEKRTSSDLAERENLTHTCLLWLWHPARGKGQSPEVIVEGAALTEGEDVHPPLSGSERL